MFNPIPHLMGWSPPHFDFECFPLLQRLKLLGGNQMTIKNKVFPKSGCHFFYDSLSKTMKKSNFKLPRQKFWSFLGNFHQLVVQGQPQLTLEPRVLCSNPVETNIFTKIMKRYGRDSNTGPLVPKSAMVAPTPPIDENYPEIIKNV